MCTLNLKLNFTTIQERLKDEFMPTSKLEMFCVPDAGLEVFPVSQCLGLSISKTGECADPSNSIT